MLSAFCQHNKEVTIRYYAPHAEKVSWYWYINYLELLSPLPPHTQIDWNIMRTDMTKKGNFFECQTTIPTNTYITYGFSILEKTSLLKKQIGYIDFNNKYPTKNYSFATDTAHIITIYPNRIQYKTNTYISFRRFSKYFLYISILLCLFSFFLPTKKYKQLTTATQQKTRWLAITSCFILNLLLLRIYNTSLLHFLIADPKTILYPLLHAAVTDTAIISLLALLLFGIEKISRTRNHLVFYLFIVCGIIISLCNFTNAQFYTITKQNFSYQWFYYASFFGTKDSSDALAANLNKDLAIAILAFIIAGVCIYISLKKLLAAHLYIRILCLLIIATLLLLPQPSQSIAKPLTENAILSFIQSLSTNYSKLTGSPTQAKDFILHQNNNPALAKQDSFPPFKNIIVLVLESVLSKYLSVYNEAIATTPFLASIKDKTWRFENFYAHVPATNKSMESLLCASFPYLSFKTITYENPAFPVPALSEILKQKNYATAFFSSGDTRYLNQEAFLKNHGFQTVLDYRSLNEKKLSTKATEKEFLSGMPDSVLHDQMMHWIDQQKQPFFCMGWTFQTHYPYFSSGKKQFGTNNIFKERYLNAITDADDLIQKIYTSLAKRNLLDSTLLVIVGDHGEAFGEHAQTTHATNIYEENIHIPFLLIHQQIQVHKNINTPGAISDIAPSILHLMQIQAPSSWQGESIFNPQKRKELYVFTPYGDIQFGIIQANKKLIVNDTRNTLTLYHLGNDPYETKNIIGNDSVFAQKTLTQLQSWIQYQQQWIKSFIKN